MGSNVMVRRRVVITGMGVVSPLGSSVDAFWDGLISGRSGIAPIEAFDASSYDTHFAGQCRDFDPTRWIDAKQLKRLDRFAQFALASAMDAVRQSRLDFATEDSTRIGVIIGSGIGGLNELEQQHIRLREKGPSRVSAFTIPKLMVNAASGNISIHFGTNGPSSAVATACASATNAMGDALRLIQRDECDIAITGGSEAAVTELGISAFNAMHALSTRNDAPEKASRPFDRDRDGFVMSEGAGILVFEEYEHARRRGATILAEVLGYGMSADGSHITQPDESGRGAIMAMQHCIRDAGVDASAIDYINAHGTSTSLGDVAEIRAIKTVFGDHARRVAVSSTKSATGHLLGASGGVELIASVLAIRNRLLPPTINLDHPDPECDLDLVPNQARDARISVAMSNSFGFGGHNACLLIGDAA
jgi:3-oxoacyl-[acyl-carrier-protein] synthase II